jgi:hypothetical protein
MLSSAPAEAEASATRGCREDGLIGGLDEEVVGSWSVTSPAVGEDVASAATVVSTSDSMSGAEDPPPLAIVSAKGRPN